METLLGESGFPVAPQQRSISGETLVHDGGAAYSLHALVPGRQFTIAQRQQVMSRRPTFASDLGSLLGRLHSITGQLDPPGAPPAPVINQVFAAPWATVLGLRRPRPPLPSRWLALRLKPRKSEFDQWITQVMPHVAGVAERLANPGTIRDLEWPDVGPIHHDINWENLIFDDRIRVRAVLDFDNAIRTSRVIEVGAAAVVLVGIEPRRVEQFVAAYEESTGTCLDRHSVQQAMVLKCVRSLLTSVSTHLGGQGDKTAVLATWCFHLYQSLQALEPR